MKFGLSESAIDKIQSVFKLYPEIPQVKIYGSRALQTQRENSDIDLVIMGAINDSLLLKIHFELDELPLPYVFDVSIYPRITHAGLKEHIDKYGQLFYERTQPAGVSSS